jgi:hypothetical protein
VWDRYGDGFTNRDAKVLQLKSPRAWVKPADIHHPDYCEDFELGNEPYRYYNW